MREALCALGNGYFATRGAAAWARADDIHYPGTYLAGGYNRLRTDIAGRVVENEDLVNFPNWLALEFRIADADWFDEQYRLLRTARSSISGAACYCEPYASRMARGGAHAQGAPPGLDERHAPGRAGAGADRRELVCHVDVRRRSTGASSTRRKALSQSSTTTPGAAGGRSRRRGRRVCWCAPASRIHVAQAARTRAFRNGKLREAHAGRDATGIHRTGVGRRPQARRDAGAGEARLVLYVAGSGHLGAGLAARKAIARAGRFEAVMASMSLPGSTCGAASRAPAAGSPGSS